MTDYAALLDDEVQAFLEKVGSYYPPDAVDLSIAEQRAVYDRMCAAFDAGYPEGVGSEDMAFAGVPCRVYAVDGAAGTLLYCHGGGFVVGGLESHDSICAEFCAGAALKVVAVDYRLSPEHPYPADLNDVLAVFDALAQGAGNIVLAGDSAGGNLVAAIAHARRGHPQLKGVLLIYPGLGGDHGLPSYVMHAEAPGLTLRDISFYMNMRAAGEGRSDDPGFAPLNDSDFRGLPPTVAITAGCDPLSSDGMAYALALSQAGVPAIWREEPGLVHGYIRARHMSQKAGSSFARMIQSLVSLRDGQLPLLD